MPNSSFYEESSDGDFVPDNVIYLNVRHGGDAPVNGLLYVLDDAELNAFDKREWIYDRTPVTSDVRGLAVEGGEVYTYVAKEEWTIHVSHPRKWAAIRKTYLDVVSRGLAELGPDFAERYTHTTDLAPPALVFNDRKRAGSHPLLAEGRA